MMSGNRWWSKMLAVTLFVPLVAVSTTLPSYTLAKKSKRSYKSSKVEKINYRAGKILDSLVFPLEEFDPLNYFRDSWGDSRACQKQKAAKDRGHEGNDLYAKRGTPIHSLVSGTVVKVGKNNYGGKRVTVKDKRGVLVYTAHLDQYAFGLEKKMKAGHKIEIKAGDILGYVGDTGSICGTPDAKGEFPPELHVGFYEPGSEKAFNPYSSLRKVLEENKGQYMRQYYKKHPKDLLKFFKHHPEELISTLSQRSEEITEFLSSLSSTSKRWKEYQDRIYTSYSKYWNNSKKKNLSKESVSALLEFFRLHPLELVRLFELEPERLAQFFDKNGDCLILLLRKHSENRIAKEELELNPEKRSWDWWHQRKIKVEDCVHHHKEPPNRP